MRIRVFLSRAERGCTLRASFLPRVQERTPAAERMIVPSQRDANPLSPSSDRTKSAKAHAEIIVSLIRALSNRRIPHTLVVHVASRFGRSYPAQGKNPSPSPSPAPSPRSPCFSAIGIFGGISWKRRADLR